MATQTALPTGLSAVSNWTLGAGADKVDAVDDPIGSNDGDTTYILVTTSGQRQAYTFPAFTVPGGSTSISINLYAYAKYSAVSGSIRLNLRNETPTVSEDADQALTSGYTLITRALANNPFTAAAWTVNEVNSEGSTSNRIAEIEVRSITPVTEIRVTQFWIEVVYTPAAGGSPNYLTLLGVGA